MKNGEINFKKNEINRKIFLTNLKYIVLIKIYIYNFTKY